MSRGLGQGELLTPPPAKRVIVPAGSTAWWGVDPSTVRVAIATIQPDGLRGVSTVVFPALAGAHRLDAVYRLTGGLAHELVTLGAAPGVIAVEQPSAPKARGVNPWLYQAVGVIMAALVAGVNTATGRRPEVVELVASQWKAVSCGSGRIQKPKRERGMPAPPLTDYPVFVWATDNGYRGRSWDEADAWGIAEWARRTYALEVR